MAALLACSQGATIVVNSSSAPYCSAYPFRLPGTPLGERVDAPGPPHHRTLNAHAGIFVASRASWEARAFTVQQGVLGCTGCAALVQGILSIAVHAHPPCW